MKKILLFLMFALFTLPGSATVRIFVQSTNGLAWVRYECTGGEVVRAFAINVTVDHGVILAVSNFLRGASSAAAPGFGVSPSGFRDYVTVGSGSNADWTSPSYSPIARSSDFPADTLPGLNSSGVTLEFGAIWDNTIPASAPPSTGTLCSLQISQAAKVSLSENASRGGVIVTPSDMTFAVAFSDALVDPEIAITGANIEGGNMIVTFKGGELESAPSPTGPWTGTGNTSGNYSEPIDPSGSRFYRVRHQ